MSEPLDPPRRALLEALVAEFAQHYSTGRRLVGVDGPEGGTHAAFADDLAQSFRAAGFCVVRASSLEGALPHPDEWMSAPPDAILLVDGTRLHSSGLRGAWHWSLWVDAVDAGRRASEAQRRYVRDARPHTSAHVVVDDSLPAAPRRRFADFCSIEPVPL